MYYYIIHPNVWSLRVSWVGRLDVVIHHQTVKRKTYYYGYTSVRNRLLADALNISRASTLCTIVMIFKSPSTCPPNNTIIINYNILYFPRKPRSAVYLCSVIPSDPFRVTVKRETYYSRERLPTYVLLLNNYSSAGIVHRYLS